ncbi:MAG: hypothetical protein R6X02_17955 [Enhygromyxa sp.]
MPKEPTMTARCPYCDARTRKSPGRLARGLALFGTWFAILAMLFGLSLALLFVIPLVPIVIVAGAALVGSAHEYAYGDRICEACGRAYEVDGEPIETAVAPQSEPAPVFA